MSGELDYLIATIYTYRAFSVIFHTYWTQNLKMELAVSYNTGKYSAGHVDIIFIPRPSFSQLSRYVTRDQRKD